METACSSRSVLLLIHSLQHDPEQPYHSHECQDYGLQDLNTCGLRDGSNCVWEDCSTAPTKRRRKSDTADVQVLWQ